VFVKKLLIFLFFLGVIFQQSFTVTVTNKTLSHIQLCIPRPHEAVLSDEEELDNATVTVVKPEETVHMPYIGYTHTCYICVCLSNVLRGMIRPFKEKLDYMGEESFNICIFHKPTNTIFSGDFHELGFLDWDARFVKE
jgi:hypothetical protein